MWHQDSKQRKLHCSKNILVINNYLCNTATLMGDQHPRYVAQLIELKPMAAGCSLDCNLTLPPTPHKCTCALVSKFSSINHGSDRSKSAAHHDYFLLYLIYPFHLTPINESWAGNTMHDLQQNRSTLRKGDAEYCTCPKMSN
jgi:hypothetical protein